MNKEMRNSIFNRWFCSHQTNTDTQQSFEALETSNVFKILAEFLLTSEAQLTSVVSKGGSLSFFRQSTDISNIIVGSNQKLHFQLAIKTNSFVLICWVRRELMYKILVSPSERLSGTSMINSAVENSINNVYYDTELSFWAV